MRLILAFNPVSLFSLNRRIIWYVKERASYTLTLMMGYGIEMTADMDVDQLSSDDSSISTDVDMVDVDSVHSFIPMVATKIRDRFKESRLQFDSRVSDHDISTLFPVEYNKSDSLHERIQRLMSCTLDVPDSEFE